MNPIFQQLSTAPLFSAALGLTCLLIWCYALYIWIRAKTITNSYKAITAIAQYEPPKGISPIVAHYLLSFGREVQSFGEITKTQEQLLILICLYERGFLSKLEVGNSEPMLIDYEINPDYSSLPILEEEKTFLGHLTETGGLQGRLTEQARSGSKNQKIPDGFDVINKFWFDYLYKDLRGIVAKLNITSSKTPHYYFLAAFAMSITFGGFFAIFAIYFSKSFLPLAFLGLLFILPQTVLYFLSVLLLEVLSAITPTLSRAVLHILNPVPFPVMLVITFCSWFIWILIFGTQVKKLYFRFNEAGKNILQQLQGYELYLKEVDASRVDILHQTVDSKINSTTMPWLLAFNIYTYAQWRQWKDLQAHG